MSCVAVKHGCVRRSGWRDLGNFARDLQTDQVWIDGIGEMFGVSNQDLVDRKGFLDMLSAEDRTEFEATFAGAIKSRAPSCRAQYRVVLDSGDELEIEELGELTYDETGKPLHLSGTIQDITERWRAEERLEFTQFALDSAVEAVFFLRRDSSVSYVNDAACDLLGYARDELLSMTVCDFNPSLLPEIVEARWHEVRQQHDDAGGGFVFETINQKKDGTVIDVEVAGRFIEYGGETFHLTFTRDITDRKRAQEALRANEAQLRLITDTLPMRIAYIGRDQRYQFVNRLVEEHEGRPADEIIGKTVEEILGDDRYERARRHLTDALAGKSSVQTWRGPFGDKVADLRATFVANISDSGEALGTIMLLEDVSEAKSLGEQLRQAQKMEAIGQLTGGIAHDFNNLLTVILGNLELLESQIDNERLEKRIDVASRAVRRGADLTTKLLSFARRRPLRPEYADLNVALTQHGNFLHLTLGEAIVVELRLAKEPCFTRIDTSELQTTLLNLVINARDAMPRGGRLTVSTERVLLTGNVQVFGAEPPHGDFAKVEVADSGTGMSLDVQERLFEPFYTTKEAGKGTGLGLSQVYGFVTQSEGYISVD